MNISTAEQILMRNLKGQKNKTNTVSDIAQAACIVKNRHDSKTIQDLFGVSMTTFDRINKINKLSSKTKKLIEKYNLGLELAYHLSRIPENKQYNIILVLKSMNSENGRRLINYVLGNPTKTITECQKFIRKSYSKDITMLVIPLPSDSYKKFERTAHKKKMDVHDFAYKILEKHIV